MSLGKKATIALVALCIASFALMLGSSLRDSAVVDELAHIPAGYSYARFFDYRLNPEHPPLLKILAAVPLLFMHLKFPTTNPFWLNPFASPGTNGEWGVGGAFLFGLKNSAYQILSWARVFPILLTIGLILFTYFWSKKLYGPLWALLPATLVGLSPIVLAQGHYVTTDVAAAFGAMLGLSAFAQFIKKSSPKNLLLAGVGLGLSELMKFSALALIPVFALILFCYVLLFAVRRWKKQLPAARFFIRQLFCSVWQLLLILFVAYALVVYPVYTVFTAHYPAALQQADTQTILGPPGVCTMAQKFQCLENADIWMAKHAATRPLAQYFLGVLMNLQRVGGSNVSYLLGYVYDSGTHLYFPAMYALKETLPALLIIFVGLIAAVVVLIRSAFLKSWNLGDFMMQHAAEFSILIFVIVYWAVSITSALNIGVRHLLPVIPLMYMLATGALLLIPVTLARNIFAAAMVVWLVGETAFAYPHFLSYYNELAGGTANGYRFADDSNYDWGQDMYELQNWLNAHPEIDKVALDFFGGSNPAYYLGNKYVYWDSSMGNPNTQNIHWFAISITRLENETQPGGGGYVQFPGQYGWLFDSHQKQPGLGGVPQPDYRVGTTIFIYKL